MRLWLGPVHQVATKEHAIRVRPSFACICWRILSKISGGRVTDAFRSGRSSEEAFIGFHDEKDE